MIKRITAFCICLFLVSSIAYGREKLDLDIDEKVLEAGEVQIFMIEYYKIEGKGGKKGGMGVILIDAPPAETWNYICNWDILEEYVPTLDNCETLLPVKPVVKGGTGESLIKQMFKFPLVTVKYALDVSFDEQEFYQDWRLVKKPEAKEYSKKGHKIPSPSFGIRDIVGFQYLEPYGDGNQSVLYYATNVVASVPVPNFLQKFIADVSLKGYLESVKKRIESKGTYKK